MLLPKSTNDENHKVLQKFLQSNDLSKQSDIETYFAIENSSFDNTNIFDKYSIISRITKCTISNPYFIRDVSSIFTHENISLNDDDVILWINGLASNPHFNTSLKNFFSLQTEQFNYIENYFYNSCLDRLFVVSDVRIENLKHNVFKKYGFSITDIDLPNHFGILKIMTKQKAILDS
jgi:hypothetical protein